MYDVTATRNLCLIKSGISNRLFFRVMACCVLCTACSLPPTLQFFCEVSLVSEAAWLGFSFIVLLYVFVFMGGLLPLFLVGSLLSRHYDVIYRVGDLGAKAGSIFFLVVLRFSLFLVG